MAESTSCKPLQPSLLDRLTDDEPQQRQESRQQRLLSPRRLREVVLRDLAWLLNTCNLAATEDLSEFPQIGESVLNFGIPDLAGHTASHVDTAGLERAIKEAIFSFEPRIVRRSVKIRAIRLEDGPNPNGLTFEIEGQLWAYPMPEQLFLRTEVDLESGHFQVEESKV